MSLLDPYKWLAALILVALLAAGAGFAWWHHGHVEYQAGVAAQSAKDAAAAAKAQKLADAQESSWRLALNSAVNWYDQQMADLQLRPVPLGPVRLCLDSRAGGDPLPGAGAVAGRARDTVSGPAARATVHEGDRALRPNSGPDIGPLLEAFGHSWAEQVAHGAAIQRAYPR